MTGKPSKIIQKSTSHINNKALPFTTFSVSDYTIYVGRNNKSNDLLTFDYAKKDDLWLHVKDAPGSHVVIKKQGVLQFLNILLKRLQNWQPIFLKEKQKE